MRSELLRKRLKEPKILAVFTFLKSLELYGIVYYLITYQYSVLDRSDKMEVFIHYFNPMLNALIGLCLLLFIFRHRIGLTLVRIITFIATAFLAFALLIHGSLLNTGDMKSLIISLVGIFIVSVNVFTLMILSDREMLDFFFSGKDFISFLRSSKVLKPILILLFAAIFDELSPVLVSLTEPAWGGFAESAIDYLNSLDRIQH